MTNNTMFICVYDLQWYTEDTWADGDRDGNTDQDKACSGTVALPTTTRFYNVGFALAQRICHLNSH